MMLDCNRTIAAHDDREPWCLMCPPDFLQMKPSVVKSQTRLKPECSPSSSSSSSFRVWSWSAKREREKYKEKSIWTTRTAKTIPQENWGKQQQLPERKTRHRLISLHMLPGNDSVCLLFALCTCWHCNPSNQRPQSIRSLRINVY